MYLSSFPRTVRYAGAILSLSLLTSGCSMFSGGPKLHKSAKGSVQLQEVSDWAFEASHPAVIDHMTMLKIVKGVVSDDGAAGKMPAVGSKPMRVFSDEDAEFLAPLLAQGLSQAKPEQIVGFTVSSSAGSGVESTAGSLYAQGGSIYLTIASPHSKKASAFIPSSAARLVKAPAFAGNANAMSVVIDYQQLAKSAMPAAMPIAAPVKPMPMAPVAKQVTKSDAAPMAAAAVSSPADSASAEAITNTDELLSKKLDELRQARETAKMKESEIAMLKREVEWMKQELRERSLELKAIRSSKVSAQQAPKKKSAEAYPVR